MIKVEQLNKSFKGKQLYTNYDVAIAKNEFVAITGPSGTGKSTLLNMIGLLEPMDSGSLEIAGITNPKRKQIQKLQRETIGYLFQNYGLIEDERVSANLEIALTYKKGTRKAKQLLMQAALNDVGLSGMMDAYIHELSGGEQQRVAIARLLLKQPDVIFADEPTGNLDHHNRDLIFGLLQKLHEQGATIVMVTHDDVLANQCQRVIQLGT